MNARPAVDFYVWHLLELLFVKNFVFKNGTYLEKLNASKCLNLCLC